MHWERQVRSSMRSLLTSTAGRGWQAEKDVSLTGPTLGRRYLESK